jgi:hypothetical protein
MWGGVGVIFMAHLLAPTLTLDFQGLTPPAAAVITTRSEIFPRAQVIVFHVLTSPRWHAMGGGLGGRCDRDPKICQEWKIGYARHEPHALRPREERLRDHRGHAHVVDDLAHPAVRIDLQRLLHPCG